MNGVEPKKQIIPHLFYWLGTALSDMSLHSKMEEDFNWYCIFWYIQAHARVWVLLYGLKVPKHEIFDGVFFASKEPIWSPDS
jgi:hypothetical protein